MITLTADLKIRGIELKNTSLERIAQVFIDAGEDFQKKCFLVHRKSVFEILTYLIRVCNVQTGRLRGSWLPFLDKYGQAARYMKYMQDNKLVYGDKGGVALDPKAMEDGKKLGMYVDEALSTTIGSNVNYADKVNSVSGYLTKTKVWGDRRYNKNFEKFFEAAEKQGWIPPKTDPTIDPNHETGGLL